MNITKSDEYMRGFRDGIKAPRTGDEIMTFNRYAENLIEKKEGDIEWMHLY